MNQLNVSINCDKWETETGFNDWQEQLQLVLDTTISTMNLRDCDVNLLLTDDFEIQQLNHTFRNVDAPTNVLSFPQFESSEELILDVSNICVGDIAMAYQTIKKEAVEFQKLFFDRSTHLFVHGVLHLLGLNHVEVDERINMEQLETTILAQFGIKDPYIVGA